jgi:hypothetical protein
VVLWVEPASRSFTPSRSRVCWPGGGLSVLQRRVRTVVWKFTAARRDQVPVPSRGGPTGIWLSQVGFFWFLKPCSQPSERKFQISSGAPCANGVFIGEFEMRWFFGGSPWRGRPPLRSTHCWPERASVHRRCLREAGWKPSALGESGAFLFTLVPPGSGSPRGNLRSRVARTGETEGGSPAKAGERVGCAGHPLSRGTGFWLGCLLWTR